jgi:hypothetical protein
MDKQDLISCMREAAAALAEFRHLLPEHSRDAYAQVEAARRHVNRAIDVLEAELYLHDEGRPVMRLVE